MRNTLSQREIQDHLYQMLSAFADYCEEHQIQYFVCGGTLLGAVRHRDLIPWDDDADVLLPRPEYEKLIATMSKERMEGYTLYAHELGNSFFPHAILADNSTWIPKEKAGICHLQMDIFPLDGLPDSKLAACFWLRIARVVKRLPSWENLSYIIWRPALRKQICRFLFVPPVKVIGKLAGNHFWTRVAISFAKCFPFKNSRYVAAVASSMGAGEFLVWNECLPLERVRIREKEFWAPACREKYLCNMYGEDWRLPPKVQAGHHNRSECYPADAKQE